MAMRTIRPATERTAPPRCESPLNGSRSFQGWLTGKLRGKGAMANQKDHRLKAYHRPQQPGGHRERGGKTEAAEARCAGTASRTPGAMTFLTGPAMLSRRWRIL